MKDNYWFFWNSLVPRHNSARLEFPPHWLKPCLMMLSSLKALFRWKQDQYCPLSAASTVLWQNRRVNPVLVGARSILSPELLKITGPFNSPLRDQPPGQICWARRLVNIVPWIMIDQPPCRTCWGWWILENRRPPQLSPENRRPRPKSPDKTATVLNLVGRVRVKGKLCDDSAIWPLV